MLHRNGKEIEQIFRNGREIALLYKNGVIIYDKRGHVEPTTSYTISYVNGENNQSITGNLPANETITTNTYTIPSTGTLSWEEHTLLGYSETQYPSYANIATSVYAPGDEITVDHNMTLYPVWSTTFQGLINEGYVTITTDKTYNDAACQPLKVASNHYPKELVTDFNDVFFSTNNKMVSVNGVVGEGTYPNVFVFDSADHWLSNDELYTLYNNNTLPHWPQAGQFKYVDWHNYNSINFIFRGTGIPFNNAGGTQDTFFRNGQAPQNITIDLGCSTVKNLNVAFRSNSANKVTPRTITFVGENNDPILVTGTMQGSFEACGSLTTISGLNIAGASYIGPSSQYYNNTFQGCANLTTLPQSLAPTGTSNGTTNRPVAMSNMFKGCTSLQEIKFIINCANVGSNADTFLNCTSLTEVYLNGINAKKNQNWDLSSTDINSESIAYIVDNLTEWSDFDSSNDTYKDLLLPNNRVLTDAQILKLNENGWKVYSGGQELNYSA